MPAPGATSLALVSTMPAPRVMPRVSRLNMTLGKYREIIIAVAFFLLFDLAVLVLNFMLTAWLMGGE